MYIADGDIFANTNRIQKFDSNDNFITEWGSKGNGRGEFHTPSGIAIDSSTGNVYVVDTWNERIQWFFLL